MRRKPRMNVARTLFPGGNPIFKWIVAYGLFCLLALWLTSGCASYIQPAQIQPFAEPTSPAAPIHAPAKAEVPQTTAMAEEAAPTQQPTSTLSSMAPEQGNLQAIDTPPSLTPPSVEAAPASGSYKTSDLLYISGDQLMRWDHRTGYAGVLVDHVSAYTASASGQRVALLRTRGITANGVALFDLAILDFKSMQVHTLLEKTPRLAHLSISPDEGWIAYLSPEESWRIYALNIQSPEQRLDLGSCHPAETAICSAIHWSPDGKALLWSDAHGIWISPSDHSSPHLAHPSHVQVVDPGGRPAEIQVRFENLRWSPDGRYVLVETLPQGSDVRWHAIVDTRRERLVRVPESFESEQLSSPVIWLQDGSILAILNNPLSSSEPPYLRHWRVVDTHDELLILNQGFALSSEEFPPPREGSAPQAYCANWLTRSAENQLLLGFSLPGSRLAPVVFSLDLETGALHKLFELPPETDQLLWTPDGGGALILDEQSLLIFISRNNKTQIDLRPILGEDAHDFNWLPPAPPA